MVEAITQIAAVLDHGGRAIIIGTDCDAITIATPHNTPYILDAPGRAAFERAWAEAGQQARAWAAACGERL